MRSRVRIRCFSLLICFLTALSVSAQTAEQKRQLVTTELGHKVTLPVLSRGRMTIAGKASNKSIGTDSHGGKIYEAGNSRWIIVHTNQIRFEVGNGYGFLFMVPELADGDRIVLKLRLTFKPSGSGEAGTLEGNFIFDERFAYTSSPIRWHIRDGDTEDKTIGQYSFEIMSGQRLLE